MWVTKLLISPVKKGFFAQNDQIWPRTGIFGQFGPGHAGLFSALLVGPLVVVARGLYLARHLFTLYNFLLPKDGNDLSETERSTWACLGKRIDNTE